MDYLAHVISLWDEQISIYPNKQNAIKNLKLHKLSVC